MDNDLEIVETCSICGAGEPVASGAFRGTDGGRVRWALWTCGHGWRSDASPVPALAAERADD
jgi:hypothetical protein